MRKIQRILLATLLILISFVLYQQNTNLDSLDKRLGQLRSNTIHNSELASEYNAEQTKSLNQLQSLVLKKLDLSVLDSCGITMDGQGWGSCVAIRPNLILTAGHCIGYQNNWIEIGGVKYKIKSEWSSSEFDVGFVEVEGVLPYLSLGNDPNVLDKVYVVGSLFDLAFLNKVSPGIVCKVNLEYTRSDLDWSGDFICDALAGPGNSGGPVLDINGNIVGIYVGYWDYIENFCICVPASQIKKALSEYDNHAGLKRDTTVGTGERD